MANLSTTLPVSANTKHSEIKNVLQAAVAKLLSITREKYAARKMAARRRETILMLYRKADEYQTANSGFSAELRWFANNL